MKSLTKVAPTSRTRVANGITLTRRSSAPQKASAPQRVRKADMAPASVLDAIVTAMRPNLREGDVEGAKDFFLSLWYHPRCGGRPTAYEVNDILCDSCDYRYTCQPGEYLGAALTNSEFMTKKGNPAWLV